MHSAPAPIRILLVDSHQIVLWGLEKLIGSEYPRMEVVGKADNREDALRLAKEGSPDIVLLDLYLGKVSSIQLISSLLKTAGFHVIIFSEVHDEAATDEAVFQGVRGVVYKEQPTPIILKAIQKVHDGELWLPRRTVGRVLTSFVRMEQKAPRDPMAEKIVMLTRKECAIVSAFANEAGASNKKIANTLGISEQTLRNHLTSIFGKLGIKNRFDLFLFAQLHHQRLHIGPLRAASHVAPPAQ